MKNNPEMQALIQSVRRDCSVVYSGHERNRDLLRELYSPAMSGQDGKSIRYKKRTDAQKSYGLSYMTERHISDLVGISIQKEREIRLAQAIASLEGEDTDSACPGWICRLMKQELPEKSSKQEWQEITTGQAKKLLTKMHRKQKSRCLLIQREDLLPLLMEVARRKYHQDKEKTGEKESPQEAQKYFCTMANTILGACSMAPLDERYALDKKLLDSFWEEEMDSFADLLEEEDQAL